MLGSIISATVDGGGAMRETEITTKADCMTVVENNK